MPLFMSLKNEVCLSSVSSHVLGLILSLECVESGGGSDGVNGGYRVRVRW